MRFDNHRVLVILQQTTGVATDHRAVQSLCEALSLLGSRSWPVAPQHQPRRVDYVEIGSQDLIYDLIESRRVGLELCPPAIDHDKQLIGRILHHLLGAETRSQTRQSHHQAQYQQ